MIAKNQLQPGVNLLSLVEQARELSLQLERGQSTTPLSAALQSLRESQPGPKLSVSVLRLSLSVRALVDAWSASDELSKANIVMRVSECSELRRDIGSYQRFCVGAHVLLIVGTADEPLSDQDRDTIRDVVSLFPLVCPIVIGSQFDCATSWWSEINAPSSARMPTLCRSEDTNALTVSMPGQLSRLRDPLIMHSQSATCCGLIEKLSQRVEHEMKYLKDQLSRLESTAKPALARSATDSDKEFVPLRERFAEQLASLDKQIALKSDRSTQPLGELSGMMRSIAGSLNIEDLEQNRSASMLKLSVNASHLARINRRIEHVLRQEFVNDLQWIERQVQRVAGDLGGALAVRLGVGVPLKFASLDVNQAWRSVENLMAIGKEVHIEFARKGFFDVLTAGRQKVFIIIMFVSLMGRMGLPNLFTTPASKAGFGLFMAAVMIGSMVNAILNWRHEKRTQSEKEMNKIRETLLAEGSKVIDQVEKTKLVVIREYLKDAARNFDATVKQFVEDATAQQRAKRESELQKQETLRKALEQRTKQTADIQRQLSKLVDLARAKYAATSATIRELASTWRAMSSEGPAVSTQLQTQPQLPTQTLSGKNANATAARRPSLVQRSPARYESTAASRSTSEGSDEATSTRSASGLAERRQRRSSPAKIANA